MDAIASLKQRVQKLQSKLMKVEVEKGNMREDYERENRILKVQLVKEKTLRKKEVNSVRRKCKKIIDKMRNDHVDELRRLKKRSDKMIQDYLQNDNLSNKENSISDGDDHDRQDSNVENDDDDDDDYQSEKRSQSDDE